MIGLDGGVTQVVSNDCLLVGYLLLLLCCTSTRVLWMRMDCGGLEVLRLE